MSDNAPLLGPHHQNHNHLQNESSQPDGSPLESWKAAYRQTRAAISRLVNSRAKHRLVLTLIILDVAGILSDIFIALITCELGIQHDAWVAPTRHALDIFQLVLSCVFLLELLLSFVADGWRYFSSKLHCFDAFVIVVGFAIDLLEHNTAEEIASLIVVLRLWRFVKIVDEFSVEAEEEAEEQSEELRERIADLEARNAALEARLSQVENV
ncbi:uncharacterized protein F4812DRAFT_435227 [Daldinia caldariorum]|uniref:uncharacterized protein n=1 Tax=Daldinia caldariorum TaxID=326644 RepID=UPI0020088859|nr:uncharacterized protein F4812DRAFT_435227 [Daldinia caldariorum]KAI1465952.1 hypothetical protein F4812DRAFT_435227 [Daldinia caldariorum]